MKKNSRIISDYLDELIPTPKCELKFNNDYELLIAIVLSAQTTDSRVNKITDILFNKYKNLTDLSNAEIGDIEKILKPLGSFRKKAIYIKEISRIIISEYDGKIPDNRYLLEKLPGVGRKTASVFLCEYYNYPEFAVDTHVNRVSKRLCLADINDDVINVENKLKKIFPKDEWGRRHKQFVLFGRYYCKAIKPDCINCKLKEICKKNKV